MINYYEKSTNLTDKLQVDKFLEDFGEAKDKSTKITFRFTGHPVYKAFTFWIMGRTRSFGYFRIFSYIENGLFYEEKTMKLATSDSKFILRCLTNLHLIKKQFNLTLVKLF